MLLYKDQRRIKIAGYDSRMKVIEVSEGAS